MSEVQIKGTFLGQPIDVTITECDDEDTASAPEVPLTPEVPSEDVPAPPAEADPAPDAAPVSDEAPNPEGNAEQL